LPGACQINCSVSAKGSRATKPMKKLCVVRNQQAKPVTVTAQAPAGVALLVGGFLLIIRTGHRL
jgi:nitrate reductase gamma subunit